MALGVVKSEVIGKTSAAVDHVGVIFQIDLLVFHRAPESFDHNIIKRSAAGCGGQCSVGYLIMRRCSRWSQKHNDSSIAVHTDPQRLTLKCFDKFAARALRSLIGIKNFRTADTKRILDAVDAKLAVECCR